MARPSVAASDRLGRPLASRYTDAERGVIRSRAVAAKMTVSEYQRQATLRARVVVMQTPGPDFATAAELRRVGNNLNQLVASYHIGGEREPEELRRVCQKLERIFDVILAAGE